MSLKQDLSQKLEAYANDQQEGSAFKDLRLKAYEQMDHLAFPLVERSKYQDTIDLSGQDFDSPTSDSSDLLPVDNKDQAYLRVLNNKILDSYLPEELKEQGVIFTSMQQAMEEHADLLEKYYMKEVLSWEADKMAAQHVAFMNAGAFLYVPDHVHVDQASQLNLIQDAQQAKAFNPHVLIVMGENAQASFVEKMATDGQEKSTANAVVEIYAQADAQLHYSSVDELGASTTAFIRRHALCEQGARVDWAIGAMNNGDVVLDAYTCLKGKGSSTDLKIVSISHGQQKQIINSHVLNANEQTTSNIFQHGAILDQSRLTFNAIGKIEKGSSGADAQQESRLLMFSEGARGDANPILLIDEYDVMAGHAASVGQIDREQLYYLMSRGISEKTAMRLAIRGFLGPVIQSIPLESVRQDLIENIERKLKSL